MTQDFAKKPRSRRQPPAPKSNVPAWVWLFTGTVLGAFIMFLVYLSGLTPTATTNKSKPATNPQTALKHSPKEKLPQPEFDFYQLLKESEVVVPTPPPSNPQPKSAPKPAAATDTEYVIQVGSFRSHGDADRLRAELLLLNLDAGIETVKVRNGETWHRVLVGPFPSTAAMAGAKNTLAENKIDTWLFKRKTSH